MIRFGPMSITLLAGALQGLALAAALLRAERNQVANRALAALILAFALFLTPYIIGYAGFYDAWPWLSFAPFELTLSFGPLLYLYIVSLTGGALNRKWPWHFVPVLLQFLTQALVFPLPLAAKNAWDQMAHDPWIDPLLTAAAIVSLAIYGAMAWRRRRRYLTWLANNRTDENRFDPSWIRNVLLALGVALAVWAGFFAANLADPARNYFDQFWMYAGLSALVIYLGVEGWRHADIAFPAMTAVSPPTEAETPTRDWTRQGEIWREALIAQELWRDPELTLAAAARALGTNTSYLSRALNEGLGVTFSGLVNRQRVAAIQQLLADPAEKRDLTTLALEAGFNSKASFNRAFIQVAQVTPTAYRAARAA
jgi:AraC-like DNA-binding protein